MITFRRITPQQFADIEKTTQELERWLSPVMSSFPAETNNSNVVENDLPKSVPSWLPVGEKQCVVNGVRYSWKAIKDGDFNKDSS